MTLPINRNRFQPSRTDKGRVASVFRYVERVAMAATMPGPPCFGRKGIDTGVTGGWPKCMSL